MTLIAVAAWFFCTDCDVGPNAVIDGAGLTVTLVDADVAPQPFPSVTVTLYEPEALTTIDCVVAPLDQA